MKRFLSKLKKAITLKKFLYFTSLLTFPLASYLIGKGENLKMKNPDIVIDTSQIDCGCGDQATDDEKDNEMEATGESVKNREIGNGNADDKDTTSKLDANNDKEDSSVAVASKQNQSEQIGQVEQGQFVASKNGQKYYPLDCASANRIKEENKIYYESAMEAEADGKELSSQCQ